MIMDYMHVNHTCILCRSSTIGFFSFQFKMMELIVDFQESASATILKKDI